MKYKRLKDLREDNDLYQKEVAKVINTTQQHYCRIERGETEITADRIIKLAELYETSTDYILGRTNIKKPYPKN